MLGLSWLPYRNMQEIPRTNRHYTANSFSAVKKATVQYRKMCFLGVVFFVVFLSKYWANSVALVHT